MSLTKEEKEWKVMRHTEKVCACSHPAKWHGPGSMVCYGEVFADVRGDLALVLGKKGCKCQGFVLDFFMEEVESIRREVGRG